VLRDSVVYNEFWSILFRSVNQPINQSISQLTNQPISQSLRYVPKMKENPAQLADRQDRQVVSLSL